eukprot:746560-Hanusia_phi.AAC.4
MKLRVQVSAELERGRGGRMIIRKRVQRSRRSRSRGRGRKNRSRSGEETVGGEERRRVRKESEEEERNGGGFEEENNHLSHPQKERCRRRAACRCFYLRGCSFRGSSWGLERIREKRVGAAGQRGRAGGRRRSGEEGGGCSRTWTMPWDTAHLLPFQLQSVINQGL